MTPTEAMRLAVEALKVAVARSRELGPDGVYTDHEQVMAELRTLGFTIVPIEPTDAQVEAVARALYLASANNDPLDPDGDWKADPDRLQLNGKPEWAAWTRDARNAYAAAVKEVDGD